LPSLAEERRRPDNQDVSLLAYSLRRAWGSLLVFLVVIWLLQFGIAHLIGASSGWKPGDTAPPSIVDSLVQFSRVAHEWNLAALEVGIAVLVILGVIGLLRITPKMQPVGSRRDSA
jgi:hypothetical protein